MTHLFVVLGVAIVLVMAGVTLFLALSDRLFSGVTLLFWRDLRREGAIQAANDAAPLVDAAAKIVGKREDASGSNSTVNVFFHVAFELENGERRELAVSGAEYGQLAEGDVGTLRMQGSRFLGFFA